MPLNLELKLEVWDSPNSAGIVIDAVRCVKLALNNGVAGQLDGAELLPDEVALDAAPRRHRPRRHRAVHRALREALARPPAKAVAPRRATKAPAAKTAGQPARRGSRKAKK